MKVKEKKWIRLRIYGVAAFFTCGLGTVLVRAYQLQVIKRDELHAIARERYRVITKLPPKRGIIYDRDGHELAVSVQVGSIYAHPRLVQNKAQTAKKLSKILRAKQRVIRLDLESTRSFVWLERKVSPEKLAAVKALGLRGIGFTSESRRYYPGKEIAAHVIGFSGDDNQGLEGLEKKYDRLLTGPQASLLEMRDALGRPFSMSVAASETRTSHNLILTLDKDIQYKAEQILAAAVKKHAAKAGHCVVMDPATGEILAMAVVPLYNPNEFRRYRPHQWRNRAVTDCYEPGSIIKPFLLAAALDRGVVSPQTMFFCERGEYTVANHVIHDTKKHGDLSVAQIVSLSSNIGAVKIGQELGYEKFCDYLIKFGFGAKTGINLIGERKGYIRPGAEAKPLDKATLFFGQGMSATSIQLAAAMSAIANGGTLMRPYVIQAITDEHHQTVLQARPQKIRRVLSPAIAGKVSQILEGVVADTGTAPLAAIRGYRVAGKTGTSQKIDPRTKRYSRKDYVAIFVGFVPVSKPRLLVLIMIDEPQDRKYGGLVAGPVFRQIGTWGLNHLGVNPSVILAGTQSPPAQCPPDIVRDDPKPKRLAAAGGVLPDFTGLGMREVLRRGTALGLRVVPEGTGLAVTQKPEPGSALSKITTVKVNFRPPS